MHMYIFLPTRHVSVRFVTVHLLVNADKIQKFSSTHNLKNKIKAKC